MNETEDWIARARGLQELLLAAAPRIEATRSLPPDVLDALHAARMFRMLLPRSLGGAEAPLDTFFQAVIALAEADASTAWCLVQNSGCSMSAAYLAPEAAREIFGDARAVLAWGFPFGPCRAVQAAGGWTVNGTWGFGSGSRHSGYLGGHCQVYEADGTPRKHDDGRPVERTLLFPRASSAIRDDVWNVIGLRGTGSDTYSVSNLFVPDAHSLVPRATGRDQQLTEDAPAMVETERREQGTLYRFTATNVYQCGFAGVGLGIARAMLDAFIVLAKKKTPSGAGLPLRDDHRIQARIALAEARFGAARAWLIEVLRDARAECEAAGKVGFELRIRMRLAATYAIQEAREIAEDCYVDAGTTAIFESNPFERRLRDMHAVSQQVQASAAHFETVGQHYLGLKPGTRFI